MRGGGIVGVEEKGEGGRGTGDGGGGGQRVVKVFSWGGGNWAWGHVGTEAV